MEYLNVQKTDKLLIIAPHPDDECIGAGGVLLRYHDLTDVIVLTDGCIGQGDSNQEETKRIRKEEFINEMKYLNINNFSFCDVRDGTLMDNLDCLSGFDLSQYTKIFVTGTMDGHADHTGAYLSLKKAIINQNLSPEVYLYEIHSALPAPTHMLDITSVIDAKKKLISFHKSQLSSYPYDEYAAVSGEYRAMQNRRCDSYLEVYYQVNVRDERIDNTAEIEKKLQKQIAFYQLLVKWVSKKNSGHLLADTLLARDCKKVAIYGFAELGKLVAEELSCSSDVSVEYVIDKKDFSDIDNIKIVKPSASNPKVDAIIVSAITSYKEIKNELIELGYKNIFSLNELVDEM